MKEVKLELLLPTHKADRSSVNLWQKGQTCPTEWCSGNTY